MPVLFCRDLLKRTEWRVEVLADPLTLGGAEKASVPLPDRELAALEAVISQQGNDYVLRDVAGQRRVFANDVPAREELLKDGDRLRVGRIAILFYEKAPPASAEPFRILETTAPSNVAGGTTPRQLEDGPRLHRAAVLGGAALVLGITLGAILGLGGRALLPGVSPPEPSSGPAAGPRPRTETALAREGSRPGEASPEADVTVALKRLEEGLRRARERDAGGAPAGESLPSPPPAPATSDDPPTSQRRLFRMFLDLLERPPTRAEEARFLPLGHEARWDGLLELAAAGGPAWKRAEVEDACLAFLGRRPAAAELEALRAELQGVPRDEWWSLVALRLSAMPEYASPERRRPRSATQRARSFLVDFLDRAPRSEEEVETVSRALLDPPAVARTLAYSPESPLPRQGGAGPLEDADWEAEFFRFLLRPPNDRERQEIARILESLPAPERRRWLAIAFALHREYGSY